MAVHTQREFQYFHWMFWGVEVVVTHLQLAGQLGPEDLWDYLGGLFGAGLKGMAIAQKWVGQNHGIRLGLTCVSYCVTQAHAHPKHHHRDDLGEREVQTGAQSHQREIHRTASHICDGRHHFGKGPLC